MNWHIGQEVVCIYPHPQVPALVKDKTYTIQSLRTGICQCSLVIIDVGIPLAVGTSQGLTCNQCRTYKVLSEQNCWFASLHFAPLDSIADISELTKVLESPAFS